MNKVGVETDLAMFHTEGDKRWVLGAEWIGQVKSMLVTAILAVFNLKRHIIYIILNMYIKEVYSLQEEH